MTVLTVGPGQAGQVIEIDDPNNKGHTIQVNVPSGAKPGQKMAVPLPEPGKTVADVQEKQKSHSASAKLAMGTAGIAAVAGLAVGGVILGDHLTGGHLGSVDMAGDVVEVVGEVGGDAVAAAGEWGEGAVEDVGAWAEGAAGDAGEWAEGAAEDAGDWLGDAAEDTGDFIMSLF